MLLTLSTTHTPATDLGYLLHKNPDRPQSFELPFGLAHVFYPEASAGRTTAALLLEVDPVALVRGRPSSGGQGGTLDQYVNDRPYVASSFMSVALSRVFGTALSGRSKDRPELAAQPLPFSARLSVLPCRGGESFLRRLFEPLGYTVTATRHALDETVPAWGDSRYFTVTLEGHVRLGDLLSHLYVLIPVLDDDKHYWVGDEEVEKLLRHGEGWLAAHPEREQIARRYLRHRHSLAREALGRLAGDEAPEPEERQETRNAEEAVLESRLSLNEQRLQTVMTVLQEQGAARVVDLGCGEGRLIKALLKDRRFTEVVGMDVSHRTLEIAQDRLGIDKMPDMQRQRVKLLHGSLFYRDQRLTGFDAATVIEVIEHLDLPRLAAFERVLFEHTRPGLILLTTPNAEYNVRFTSLPAGTFRHRDHRFEWTRAEFEAWAARMCERFGYTVRFLPVGENDAEVGAPTQLAVFAR
ncbi:3' terminal RNA ribose 2'-O-methyltransferase Hen1 [Corallococcus aberystwythensis]|uniref:Small RNA 2'-O-methyltransferase n=1 Tax=Corallococcus aberystwythensis TaxID=2316722 RepID=A0A3A8PT74_9BACT|nr:3' terminal RNA ribose 2'-O-methyltransferase Hen1 [Corallococcus aberystwythensis]RKH55612.1 3' terminal RNA ribose 2'-O-methyltransferase Hen1 [Corallococcus aberystwythensis]